MTGPASSFPKSRGLSTLVAGCLLLASCVSYDETGVVHPDGSGEVRIAIGLARDNVDHQKIEDVRAAVIRLAGLRWVSTLDSLAGNRRWTGAVIHFDSVEALRPLNTVIALESLFGRISLEETDSGTLLRRSIVLPSGSQDDHDFNRIRWTFPGEVVATDHSGRIDSTGSKVRWDLPLGEDARKQASLMVRWRERPPPVAIALPDWSPVDMRFTLPGWLGWGLQGACLLAALVAAILVGEPLRRKVRLHLAARDDSPRPDIQGASTPRGKSRRKTRGSVARSVLPHDDRRTSRTPSRLEIRRRCDRDPLARHYRSNDRLFVWKTLCDGIHTRLATISRRKAF